jgi:TRAP transporter TAXI family solute receptor
LLIALLAASRSSYAEKFITIGTADELGVYYPAGGAICRLVKRGLQEHGIRCFVEPSGGSIDNLAALRRDRQDLALVQSDWAYDAYHGRGAFKKPNPKLRFVFSLHTEAFTVLVRADSPIRRFRDLKGKRVNLGDNGSGGYPLMEKLMKVEGWSKNSFRALTDIKASEQAKALCENKTDAVIYVAGHPNGAVQEAATLCKTRLVPVAGPEIDRMIAANPYYYKITIPAGMYRGTSDTVQTFGVKALLLATSDVDDSTIYHVVKAVFDNLDNFKTLHPVFSLLKQENMIHNDIGIPLHPGAVKFYRESGLMK